SPAAEHPRAPRSHFTMQLAPAAPGHTHPGVPLRWRLSAATGPGGGVTKETLFAVSCTHWFHLPAGLGDLRLWRAIPLALQRGIFMRRLTLSLATALVAGTVMSSAGVASAAVHVKPVITATQVTFAIPSSPAGIWHLVLTTYPPPPQRLGSTS